MPTLTLEIPEEMYEDCLAQLRGLAAAICSTVEHAAVLTLLTGQMYQRNSEEDGIEMYYDQFGKPIESDRVYGIGRTETKCVPHETKYDAEIDEIVIRRKGSKGSFERLYQDGATSTAEGTFFFLLNADLVAYEDDPREDGHDAGLQSFLNDHLSKITVDQQKQSIREQVICKRLGVSQGDGSDLADLVMRFVRDPDSTSVSELMRAAKHQLA